MGVSCPHFEQHVHWISKMLFGDLEVVYSLKNWKILFRKCFLMSWEKSIIDNFEEPVNWISKMCFGDLGVVCSLKNWKLNFFCAFWWSGRSRWCAVGKTEKLNFENAFWWSGRWLEFVDSLTWSPCKLNFKIHYWFMDAHFFWRSGSGHLYSLKTCKLNF